MINWFRKKIHEPRLLGTWRSDANATFEAMRNSSNVPVNAPKALANLVGKLTITYQEELVVLENCELAGTYRYRILERSGQRLVVEIRPMRGWRSRRSTLTLAEDGYWVDCADPRYPWFREKFVRVPEGEAPTLQNQG